VALSGTYAAGNQSGAGAGMARQGGMVGWLGAVLVAANAATAAAQAPPAGPTAGEDVEALLRRVQEQLERLDAATSERDRALKFLEDQVQAATGALSATGETAESLRAKAAELSTTVETLAQDRDQLSTRLETVEDERDRRIRDLEAKLVALDRVLVDTSGKVTAVEADQARTRGELQASRARVASLEGALAQRDASLGDLEARLGQGAERLQASAGEVQRLTALLGRTTEQLLLVQTALGRSEGTIEAQRVKIDELGARLNVALAEQVEELARYRSEFFGRLRTALGDRPDLRIVGDRFVFQSEILFASGSADLGPDGAAQLRTLATSLREVAATIPADIDWVLRVDGHTDRRPIRGDGPFRSNWELSTARAIAVVELLVREGIPPHRLAAAGFGEHKPLDIGEGEPALARNRRIEFKLTEG
jgi:chemotaxis protein MotB